MNPYILIIKQFLIDKHVTNEDLLELVAKNKNQKAPKKLSVEQVKNNETKERLLKLLKKK